MAIVKFFDECEELDNGDVSYEVYIEDYSRYTGPPGTPWQLIDASSYQFRTPADEVADVVEAVRAGKMTLKAAWSGCSELQEVFEQHLESSEDDDGPAKTKSERLKEFIEMIDLDELFTSLLGDNPYWCEDAFNDLAPKALDYPRWAKGEPGEGGEMGTGYGAGVVVITKGHDLAELWQWLEKRQAEILAGKDQPSVAKKSKKKHARAK